MKEKPDYNLRFSAKRNKPTTLKNQESNNSREYFMRSTQLEMIKEQKLLYAYSREYEAQEQECSVCVCVGNWAHIGSRMNVNML